MRIVQQHEFTYKKMASIQPRASPVKFARSWCAFHQVMYHHRIVSSRSARVNRTYLLCILRDEVLRTPENRIAGNTKQLWITANQRCCPFFRISKFEKLACLTLLCQKWRLREPVLDIRFYLLPERYLWCWGVGFGGRYQQTLNGWISVVPKPIFETTNK